MLGLTSTRLFVAMVAVSSIMGATADAGALSICLDDKKPSFPIEPAAEAFVSKFERTELAKDDVFVKILEDLAKSDLSPAAKADAFALMQQKIGWLFVGAARLFPGKGFAESQSLVISTLFAYQQKMPEGLEVAPLLELAKNGRADHPLRPSNALLLATILNVKASREAVEKAIDLKAIEGAQVPAIDLHNLAFASALTADPKIVARAVDLLPRIESDESREDLIVITSIYRNTDLRDKIEGFVKAHFPAKFDNSTRTAIVVLAHAGPPDHFRDFYKALGERNKDAKEIEILSKFWDSDFRDKLQSDDPARSPLKIWDGFAVQVENDGAWISTGKTFRYWISFQ